jgi:hypothetical protein
MGPQPRIGQSSCDSETQHDYPDVKDEVTDPLTLNYAQHSPLGKVDECNGGLVLRQVDLI